MVLDVKQTTVAYRCPHCGAGVMSVVGIFSLSADMIKLKCDCGHSEMTMVYTNDKQIRLTVPCIFCPKPHTFTVSSSIFFGKELFVLPCPYSDMNIAMMGEVNNVKAELARTELQLLDMLEESGIDSLEVFRNAMDSEEEKTLGDPQIFDIIMFVIRDLDAEGKIYCRCFPDGREPLPEDQLEREDSDYEIDVTDEGVEISCAKCGAKKVIPTDSMLTAHAFLNSDYLKLD